MQPSRAAAPPLGTSPRASGHLRLLGAGCFWASSLVCSFAAQWPRWLLWRVDTRRRVPRAAGRPFCASFRPAHRTHTGTRCCITCCKEAKQPRASCRKHHTAHPQRCWLVFSSTANPSPMLQPRAPPMCPLADAAGGSSKEHVQCMHRGGAAVSRCGWRHRMAAAPSPWQASWGGCAPRAAARRRPGAASTACAARACPNAVAALRPSGRVARPPRLGWGAARRRRGKRFGHIQRYNAVCFPAGEPANVPRPPARTRRRRPHSGRRVHARL